MPLPLSPSYYTLWLCPDPLSYTIPWCNLVTSLLYIYWWCAYEPLLLPERRVEDHVHISEQFMNFSRYLNPATPSVVYHLPLVSLSRRSDWTISPPFLIRNPLSNPDPLSVYIFPHPRISALLQVMLINLISVTSNHYHRMVGIREANMD